jgi:DNA-binding transcriptional MocR family regulator
VLSIKRRQAIYALCQKYDVIIVEDDPYWYLQFPSSLKSTSTTSPTPIKSSSFAFLDSLIPSYLSIDVDGRVVRLDTFSKTVAPGCRLGWITAQPAMIERLLRITETSTQQPSGFVQSMVAELLIGPTKGGQGSGGAKDGSGWDLQGWVRWLEGLRGEYERRMTTMSDILDKGKIKIKNGRRKSLTKLMGELSTSDDDLEDWSVIQTMSMYDFPRPQGGMFLWITMAFHTHPLAGSVLGPRLAQALWVLWTTEPYRVLVSPGTMFSPSDEIREEHGWKCFRLCFAAAPKAELANISRRFVQGVHAFWDIKDVAVIDDLLKDIDEAHVKDTTGMAVMTGFC